MSRTPNVRQSVAERLAQAAESLPEGVDLILIEGFRPLLYVIPFALVADRVGAVPLARRASLFHEEYIIENLPRALFDVIEWLEV